jgi:Tol biopolymer transport system component
MVIVGLLIFGARLIGMMLLRGAVLAYTTDQGIELNDVERGLSKLAVNDPLIRASDPISWSPDGQYIAYVADHEVNDNSLNKDIYLVSLADFSVRNLTQTPTKSESSPLWTPDSRTLGFVARSSDSNLVTTEATFYGVDISSSQTRYQITFPGDLFEPGLGLASGGIRFSVNEQDSIGTLFEIFVGKEDTSLKSVFRVRHQSLDFTWSPDGRWLVYNAFINVRPSLQVFDMNTLQAHEFASVRAERIVWSPDSRHFAYTTQEESESGSHKTAYIGNVETGEQKAITPSNKDDYYTPIWSPDGRQVVVVSDRDGTPALWSTDISTASSTKINSIDYGYVGISAWSPNGRWLAVYAYDLQGGPRGPFINLIDVQNRSSKYLADGNFPVWQPQ